ncbi:hypothetical protein HXX76_004968 [Chlamydomonas incerta]|uniref:EGF-like domain-containing protein n=1 Tax=Chlamydomonas incerta TaxID=51695 RepID=A0A835W8F5_CHLIN|nr:hypothetical protein HXX76_004968 [Chlamydomonas incerta]|eukprot:KAG2439616.1 hypothetical protein HXX76_004968 [Chlamydomonas incerta]
MSRLGALLALLGFLTVLARAEDAVLKTAVEGKPFNVFQELKKECDPGCQQCNRELGECECPYGLSGPTCQVALWPACRTSTTAGLPVFVGRRAPRNCHCYAQLFRATCLPGSESRCSSHTVAQWPELKCFEQVDKAEQEQLSELPEKLDDPKYRWRKGVLVPAPAGGAAAAAPGAAAGRAEHKDMQTLLVAPTLKEIGDTMALSKCPNRCRDRGICIANSETIKTPSCLCHPGFTGTDCGDAVPPASLPLLCPNGCGGRGSCVAGFCACQPPYWGIGCSRSRAYQPAPDSISHPYYPSLKIYMYDIPISVVGPQPFDDSDTTVYPIYQASMHLMDMFLADGGGVRTENPWEANLFYVPTFAYYSTANLGDPTAAVVRAIDWVAAKFPFFSRYGGRDHFVVMTADRGACYLKPLNQTRNLIRLVHFGLEKPNLTEMGPLVEEREYGCFKGGRDVVLAPYFRPKAGVVRTVHEKLLAPGGAEELLKDKSVLFFFSGDVRHHEPEYSGGVRQALSALLSNTTSGGAGVPADVVFKAGFQPITAEEYEQLLGSAKFCLAPYGHGWGIRLTHALMHGCVPVIIQDRVRQPWEDLLHYPDFSIRVSKAELPRLVELLRAVPAEDVAALMREGARVYRAFVWQPELGGLAYNYTLASLRRRLSHIRGELYEAGTRRR